MPGYISVPAGSFTVKELCTYLQNPANIMEARKFARSYIDAQRAWEKALDSLKDICPDVRIARKNERDWEIDKFTLASLKFIKYLKRPLTISGEKLDKVQIFNKMIRTSHSKQLIFGESKKRKQKGGSYKVYRDLSIEIPFDFDEEVMDKFIVEVCFEQGLFGNILQADDLKMK